MSGPRLLDLFCGEGGAAKGYVRAGWHVHGVDLKDVGERYPGCDFVQTDALAFLAQHGHEYDAIHASPPCQGYSRATAGNPGARSKHKRLIAATRELLILTGRPWVIENVEQAIAQMRSPITLCGRMFKLESVDADGLSLVLDRHRLFESNVKLTAPTHPRHDRDERQVAGVYGGSRRAERRCPRDEKGRVLCKSLPCDHETYASLAPRDRHAARHIRKGGYVPRSKRVQQDLLGIDWMTVKGMQESIPPDYAEFVGKQLRQQIETGRR